MTPIRLAFLLLSLVCTAAAAQAVKPVTLVRGLDHPWSFAFLPGGDREPRVLVTEKAGRLRIARTDGEIGPAITGLPPVDARGQGGLLDVVPDPQYERNRWIYWSYSEPAEGGTNSTAVARGKLETEGLQGRLTDVQVIFRQAPKVASSAHFGSRLVFARDGRLFVTLGDRFSRRDDAQTLGNLHGKIVRIEADGRVPADNPFVARQGARPEIWSLGHRNVQGAALHPQTGELWTHEHGPQGGDEVNVADAGRNYGWPVITYGAEYGSGAKIGEGMAKAGMEQPLVHWVPSIAPSGMAFLTSERYPGWKGGLFVGALRGQLLVRLEVDGRKVVSQERLLQDFGERIRDVRQGPDGWLYLLTDSSDGKLVRLER
ncbi:PQQ-dependent sugar dehydrogenase [Piscinibacter sp. XHJ-5]|uniref:PQQ-dependent sugar dehydrogenase n=1 Tax=Piscinibacter sp. XHJ-5 TaxID=3037797 RepID=UPI002452DCA6|nr:PQQ-dependent sugar dehydrogenase [Piscinibacter sp. XHJ-5]